MEMSFGGRWVSLEDREAGALALQHLVADGDGLQQPAEGRVVDLLVLVPVDPGVVNAHGAAPVRCFSVAKMK